MARGATIYKAHLELSLVDRGVYAESRVTVARHPSETLERTLARVLAFALRFDDALEFGRGVSATDEPDLWIRESDGRPREWIEVGQPDAGRLVKAARKSRRTILFAFGEGLGRWRTAQLASLDAPANLAVARIDDDFLAELASLSDRQLRWSLTLHEGTIFLTTGEESLQTRPEIWLGDPLA